MATAGPQYICENEMDKQHMVGKRPDEFKVPKDILSQYVGKYDSAAYPGGVVVTMED